MKVVLIFCCVYCVLCCICSKFPTATNPRYRVPHIINFRGINESIVYVRENNTDDELLKSLVATLYSDQTVALVRGDSIYRVRKSMNNHDPNTILLTERIIQPHELKTQAYKIMFRSFWSPVYIIVTIQNGSETCENGKFNKTYLRNVDDCLTYIWRRYKIVRLVVSFPYTCPNKYIIYGETKPSNVTFYDRSLKIIEARSKHELKRQILNYTKPRKLTAGYPLRVNIFERFPTSIKICDNIDFYRNVNLSESVGFCGLDGLVMSDYIAYYRFNLSVPKDETCDSYGFVDPMTNHMSGSLGCILNKKFDISFNSRFMVMYTSKHYFYLHYIATDTLAVIMKIPSKIPLWQYAFNAFSPKSAILLGVLILVLGIITWASAWVLIDVDNQEPRKLYIYIFIAMTCTLFGFYIKRSNRFRVLRGTSLICSIIILAYYQGHVNNVFTTVGRYKELKRLGQLYKSDILLYSSPSIQSILVNIANEDDQEQMNYFNKMIIHDGSKGPEYVLEDERAAITARGQDAQIQVLMNFTDAFGSPLLYVLEEPFNVYYLSYICANSFLFTEESLLFMMRLLEAGLPNKYYVWTRRSLWLGDTYPETSTSPRPTEKIALAHLKVAFTILTTGYLLAAMCFFLEVYYGRKKQKKYTVEFARSRSDE